MTCKACGSSIVITGEHLCHACTHVRDNSFMPPWYYWEEDDNAPILTQRQEWETSIEALEIARTYAYTDREIVAIDTEICEISAKIKAYDKK